MSELSWEELEKRHDPAGIRRALEAYPEMLLGQLEVPDGADFSEAPTVVVSGMGGSAYAAELVRDALGPESKQQIYIHRGYKLPAWVESETPVILSSVSGNTEEELSDFENTYSRGLPEAVISSGGELTEDAVGAGVPHIKLPPVLNFPPALTPRLSLPYGFRAISTLLRAEFDYQVISTSLGKLLAGWRDPKGVAGEVAAKIGGQLPTLYVDQSWAGAGKVWQAQFNENAKATLGLELFSEFNHNEIQTWGHEEGRVGIFLKSPLDTDRIKKRQEFAINLWSERVGEAIVFECEANDRLLTVWQMTYLGLWVSYYLALVRGVDPSDISTISELKEYLRR